MPKSNVFSYSWKILVGIGTLTALIGSFFTIQDAIDRRMKKEIEVLSLKIINEINNKTETLADFQKDDLWDRIQLLETEIESRQRAGQPIPERMRIHLRSMKERFQEMKNPWRK